METPRQIAQAVLDYSKLHENDALMAGEPGGDPKWSGWEEPYYCQTIDELETEIAEEGYTTTAQAIRAMTKGFQLRHEYIQDIRGAGDADMDGLTKDQINWRKHGRSECPDCGIKINPDYNEGSPECILCLVEGRHPRSIQDEVYLDLDDIIAIAPEDDPFYRR
jgi:hypothetical protein